MPQYEYTLNVEWTGNTGQGTASYEDYGRDHRIVIDGKPDLQASSDPHFLGDPSRHNPEQLLVAAVAGCHLLWYLHLCADAGVVVVSYEDRPVGTMEADAGGGEFTQIVLRPRVVVDTPEMIEAARELHAEAHSRCFIARSVAFPISHEPEVECQEGRAA